MPGISGSHMKEKPARGKVSRWACVNTQVGIRRNRDLVLGEKKRSDVLLTPPKRRVGFGSTHSKVLVRSNRSKPSRSSL